MMPGEAPEAIKIAVGNAVVQTNQMIAARAPRVGNALRNAELTVLSGNSSPSPPGSPPGRRTGHLRLAWSVYSQGGGGVAGSMSMIVGIKSGAHYAGYLEHGTRKMAARPFTEKIKVTAAPKIKAILTI